MSQNQENMPQHDSHQSMLDIFTRILIESVDRREQGTRFERAVAWFLRHDPAWSERITAVWLWDEAPTNDGQKDTGIDLVALDEDGSYWAIQAKCYSRSKLAMGDVSTFFAKSLIDDRYQHYMIADTAAGFTSTLEDYINDYPDKDIVRLDLDTMRDSNLDWRAFIDGTQPAERKTHDPRPHQREAIDAVETELSQADRCSLVMACGTGKTLTALRLTEEMVGDGGTVLFLAPSISLVSQSMRDWVNQTRTRINVYVVCSDGKASKVDEEAYGRLSDIPFPATTNPLTVAQRFKVRDDALNVVFSTYQSIQVIHDAQQLGLTDFDLTICDEAHRTTGVMDGETAFQKVHDPDFIRSAKRLYMTATPRIFSENAKSKASEGAIEIASMDDETLYGKVAYRLGFGQAVDRKLLTDYKIVVMQVSEDMMGRRMQEQYGRADSEIPLDDAAKFVGCWKALFDRRHAKSVDDLLLDGTDQRMTVGPDDTKRVLHHAIAFAPSIKASKALTAKFRAVINDYTSNLEQTDENQELLALGKEVTVGIDHVDGTMDALTRKTKLDWLAAETGPEECRILSNARCLAEGVDVPSLDAIIYLSSRKSKVDIIQSVGRVMRRAPGKEYGYIIIPVVVPLGADPDTVISSGAFKPVWEVVTALRSHDERLDAIINAAGLGDTDALSHIIEVDVLDESRLHKPKKRETTGGCGGYPGDPDEPGGNGTDGNSTEGEGVGTAVEVELDLNLSEMAKAINAQIVRRCGTKIYWGEWTDDIATITRARASRIASLVETEPARTPFLGFLDGLRASLNPGYSETDAIAVLAQHEITRPIFATLFTNQKVLNNNPIVRGLDRTMDALYEAGLEKGINSPTLRGLYSSVRLAASQLRSDIAKQNLIKEIYNEFFTKAFKDTADALGIVYTPVEVVDAQLHMVQRVLEREFSQNLGDKGVHILDGFAGTGTYLCRLIEDTTLISDDDLPYKYGHDLHSNEIVPLAATIMDINIEQSYHKRIGGEYRNFPGALLTDTFQMHEQDDTLDDDVFTENTERVQAQKNLPIRVIIGNPPYNNEHKELYPSLKKRIEETYVINSSATNSNSLYNSYYYAMRWASDRIGEAGIVCFVSGAGWLRGGAGDGVRKTFVEEFNDIYVYDLRGNRQFTNLTKEQLVDEGDNIFGSGSKSPIVISLLVKNPNSAHRGVIHYAECGLGKTLEEKKIQLKALINEEPKWQELIPDEHGDWFDHRDDAFYDFVPMAVQTGVKKQATGLFSTWSAGVKTQRDAWAYNFSREQVDISMRKTIDFYNAQLDMGTPADQLPDSPEITWTRAFRQDFAKQKVKTANEHAMRVSMYRPFCKEHLWFDRQVNEMVYLQPSMFPEPDSENFEICIVGKNTTHWSPFITKNIPDLHLMWQSQCFPLYWYEEVEVEDTEIGYGTLFGTDQGMLTFEKSDSGTTGGKRYARHSAITDTALRVFRNAYPHTRITKEDIFYYVYGILHSPEYRKRFENNLRKELPRIPLAKDFRAFMKAGRELADLHLNYESVDRWPLMEQGDKANPGRTEKMTYPVKVKDPETGKKVPDRTILKVAENLTIHGIPLRAYEYVVNGKSAIGWLIDRYKVTTDKKSGIVNDPNEYSDDPRYIVDLVERVITVSMRTLDIVDGLPPLDELPQPVDWPSEWR